VKMAAKLLLPFTLLVVLSLLGTKSTSLGQQTSVSLREEATKEAGIYWGHLFTKCGDFFYSGYYKRGTDGKPRLTSIRVYGNLAWQVGSPWYIDEIQRLNGFEFGATTTLQYGPYAELSRSAEGWTQGDWMLGSEEAANLRKKKGVWYVSDEFANVTPLEQDDFWRRVSQARGGYRGAISCDVLSGFSPSLGRPSPTGEAPGMEASSVDDLHSVAGMFWNRLFTKCGDFHYSGYYRIGPGGKESLLSASLYVDLHWWAEPRGVDDLDQINGVQVKVATGLRYSAVADIIRSPGGWTLGQWYYGFVPGRVSYINLPCFPISPELSLLKRRGAWYWNTGAWGPPWHPVEDFACYDRRMQSGGSANVVYLRKGIECKALSGFSPPTRTPFSAP